MRELALTLMTFLAMARARPWEPLLIIVAIMVANAGLITVLLINEGAKQGEFASDTPNLLSMPMIVAKPGHTATRYDYATLRKAGLTEFIALAQRDVKVRCDNYAKGHLTQHSADSSAKVPVNHEKTISLIGVDLLPVFASTSALATTIGESMSSTSASAASPSSPSASPTEDAPKPNSVITGASNVKLASELAQMPCENHLYRTVSEPEPPGAAAPSNLNTADNKTHRSQALYTQLSNTRHADSESKHFPPRLSIRASDKVPAKTILVSMTDFYRAHITLDNTPLFGFVSLTSLSTREVRELREQLPNHLTLKLPPTITSTGSLPDSFKLNIWAMGMLMAIVALFVVLNALNLMYQTRLNQVVRLRQLGIARRPLLVALMGELLAYCALAVPVGVWLGWYSAGALTPTLSSTFSSLFNALFVAPTVNITLLLSQSLLVTFAALTLFALVPATQLSRALQYKQVTSSPLSLSRLCVITLIIGGLLWLAVSWVHTSLFALIYVAFMLLSCCGLVILWLPQLTLWLSHIAPRHYPVLHYAVASTHALSGRTRLAVAAFFIALTANIGMNVMTDSFRLATESWLSQRLNAPAYLYTDKPLSQLNLATTFNPTPVWRANARVQQLAVTLRSYPTSTQAKAALMLDTAATDYWQAYSRGEGVFISQQLAFQLGLTVNDPIYIESIADATTSNNSPPLKLSRVQWQVLGIYPDYGNIDPQLLLPSQELNAEANFSGVVALYGDTADVAEQLNQQGQLYTQEAILALSMNTFDKTFVLTDGLNLATLLVAGFAFALSVSMLALTNKHEVDMLITLGVSRVRVKLALFAQYLLLCLITALIAIPFGVYLAWVFINLVNRYAFYWIYPLDINIAIITQSVLVAMATVAVIILLPLGKLKSKLDLRQETAS